MKTLPSILGTLLVLTLPLGAASNRYNVLFIAVDDLRPALGCYGDDDAQTPHIDRFARSAVVFNRHYVQVPTCGASRYALLTGRSPASSGVTAGNNGLYEGRAALSIARQEGAQTLPETFRRSGYHTACLGKISHTPDGRVYAYDGSGNGRPELPHAWDALPTPFGHWERGWGIFFAYEGGRHREDGRGHRDLMEFTAESDDALPDGLLAEAAIDQLRAYQESGQRFFLGLGFFKPHLPFVAPRRDWDAFAPVRLSPPSHSERIDSPFWHQSNEFYKYDMAMTKNRPLAVDDQLRARRAYHACVRYTDRQVGRVLAALDELGLADETLVILWGDHGWHLGEHALWGKHSPFEGALRSALILRAPGVSVPGLHSDALVESTDLYPTLLALCRPQFTRTHAPLDGRDLTPVLTGARDVHRTAALSYWRDAVSVRSNSFRLIARRKKDHHEPVALYDLREGLDEGENLIDLRPAVAASLFSHVPCIVRDPE